MLTAFDDLDFSLPFYDGLCRLLEEQEPSWDEFADLQFDADFFHALNQADERDVPSWSDLEVPTRINFLPILCQAGEDEMFSSECNEDTDSGSSEDLASGTKRCCEEENDDRFFCAATLLDLGEQTSKRIKLE